MGTLHRNVKQTNVRLTLYILASLVNSLKCQPNVKQTNVRVFGVKFWEQNFFKKFFKNPLTKSGKCGIIEKSAPEPPGSTRQNLGDISAANLSLKNKKQKGGHIAAI